MTQKWWHPDKWKDDKGVEHEGCAEELNTDETNAMGMENVGGVFLVLIVGIVISLVCGLLEFAWAVRKTSIECKVI